MKSVAIVGSVFVAIVTIALVLTNLATSDIIEPVLFTNPPTATPAGTGAAGDPTTTVTATAQPTGTATPGTSTGIPASKTYFPPVSLELDAGQSGRFILADGSSRNIKLIGTDLVYAYGTVTVWSTATVEISGDGLDPVVKEIPAAFFERPTVIYDVRIMVDITKEFNDRRLRDGGGTQHDARLSLSDARLPMTDASQFAYPYPDLVWQAGSKVTYWQGLQGTLLDLYHHGALDMGMPKNTEVHAWAKGTFEATDRGFDWMIQEKNTTGGLGKDITVLHLGETSFDKDGTVVQPGELLGLSDQANWYHTHLIWGYELPYILAEWYEHDASPERLSYVSDWLVAGPFENVNGALRLETDYLGNEATVNPKYGDPAAGTQWKYWDNMVPGVVMVAETTSPFPNSGWEPVNGNHPNGATYMATYVNSPDDRSAVLNLGASDSIKVWVGDQQVLDQAHCVPGDPGEGPGLLPTINIDEFQAPITLKQGWNRILVKTSQTDNCTESWQVSMRISDEAGKAMDDLVVDAMQGEPKPEQAARPDQLPDTDGSQQSTGNNPSPTGTASPSPTATALPQGSLLPSQSPPAGISPKQVPMFVVIGSDDNNRAGGVEFFVNAFKDRVNPAGSGNAATYDGSPALMSFYLIGTDIYGPNIDSQEWRDQYMAAYNDGHEIGNHGFYGLSSDAPHITVDDWLNNWLQPTHDALVRMGIRPEDIKGFRAAEDSTNSALYDALEQLGYEYSNSATTNHSTNQPAWWPGTLDNGWPGGPTWDDIEYGSHPGFWEVPQTYAVGGSAYCDKDWFNPPTNGTGEDWKNAMEQTFLELYNSNRAPLSICIHSQDWGPTHALATGGSGELTPAIQEHQQAFNEFLDWLLSGQFPEVRVVTHEQLIEWMKHPVPLATAASPTPTPVALSSVADPGNYDNVQVAFTDSGSQQRLESRDGDTGLAGCGGGSAGGQEPPLIDTHLVAAVTTSQRSSFARRARK